MISLVSFSLGRDGSWGIELDPDLNVQLNSLSHVFFILKQTKTHNPNHTTKELQQPTKGTTTTKQKSL